MIHFYKLGQQVAGKAVYIKVQAFAENDIFVTVSWCGGEDFHDVTADAYLNAKFGATEPTPTVNWAAMGAQDPEYARVYANLILVAHEVALALPSLPVGAVEISSEEAYTKQDNQ